MLLPDGGRGYLSKIFNDDWMADYGFLTAETAEPRVADVLARKGAGLPEFVHVHPNETVAAAIAILREYDVSQLPVVKDEPPVMAAEVVGSVVERDLLEALVTAGPAATTSSASTCRRRCRWSGPASRVSAAARAALEQAGRGGRAGRRQAGRRDHPPGRARLPGQQPMIR